MAPASSLVNKIKVQLKLSISRLRMVQQKDTALAKQQRRAMAQLLEQGKEESAKIRVENIIRSDITTELYEVLELYCELLLARTGLMEGKDCDPGLEEAVQSIIYAAPRTEIKELQQTRQLLIEKYGKDFAMVAMDNKDGKVAERVLKKLRVEPPEQDLAILYLKEIARTYGVPWPKPAEDEQTISHEDNDDGNDEPGDGEKEKVVAPPLTTAELKNTTPPRDIGPRSPVQINAPSPSSDNVNPTLKLPQPPELKPGSKLASTKKAPQNSSAQRDPKPADSEIKKPPPVGGKIPDVDELAKRFAALKR